MDDRHDVSEDPQMESRLRSARPRPDAGFVQRLEADLFDRAPRRVRAPTWRPRLAAAFAVAALAALTLVFDLAGIGPFGSSDNGPVQAHDKCRTVIVVKRERQPVQTKTGVELRLRPVKRHVTRCH